MPQNYIIIGGGAYAPGSAAAKRAQELYNAMPRAPATPTVPSPSVPQASAPTTFPSYLPRTGTTSSGNGLMAPNNASLGAAPAHSGQGAYGLVPTVPNPISTAAGSIAGNTANLPGLSALATDTTKLNANLGALPFQMNLPNYGGMIGSASQGITSNLAGVIDPQEWTQLQQRMAERGARVGISPSSPNFNTALMTALDQSIAGRQALGQQQLNAAIGRTPTGQAFNTAGQQIQPTDVQAAQYQANVLGAAPDPTMAAQANLDSLLKAIEAGRVGGLGGIGSGGGGGGLIPRSVPTAPGSSYYPSGYGGYGGGGYSAPSYSPRYAPTAPGTVPPAQYGYGYDYPTLKPGEGNLGDSVFSPYSLGGYDVGGGQPSFLDPNILYSSPYGSSDSNAWLDQFLSDWEQGV